MTLEAVRELLLRRAKGASRFKNAIGVKAWCKANGVSDSHASEFLNGQRLPASDLLEALGLEWRIMRKKTGGTREVNMKH